MIIQLNHHNKFYKINLNEPLDISIPLVNNESNVNAWYAPPPSFQPVKYGDWVGSVEAGSSVNFRNIYFNPHAHGTHTECAGHITKEIFSVNKSLRQFHYVAYLHSVLPEKTDEDFVITEKHFSNIPFDIAFDALIIRTLPNNDTKLNRHYSNTNPPFIDYKAIEYLNKKNIRHLLIDLPSVDKEKDEGKLLAHKAFWFNENEVNLEKTITEMVYVSNDILDGLYMLNLMIAPFENDASPSKPVLYRMVEIG
jgi:kynurenine formamidase